MGKFIDMTGWVMSEHGVDGSRLTVISRAEDYTSPKGSRSVKGLCKCSCGKIVSEYGTAIRKGIVKSCGCYQKDNPTRFPHRNKNGFETSNDGTYMIGHTNIGDEFGFDIEDYNVVKKHCGHYNKNGYVVTSKNLRLHRLVLGITNSDILVDHINHPPRNSHKVDNRKVNLRVVTRQQNIMNSHIPVTNTSGVKGVYYFKRDDKWQAKIEYNGKQYHLGYFENKDDAIKARKLAEEKYFCDYRLK